jgi:hypothetical protein
LNIAKSKVTLLDHCKEAAKGHGPKDGDAVVIEHTERKIDKWKDTFRPSLMKEIQAFSKDMGKTYLSKHKCDLY